MRLTIEIVPGSGGGAAARVIVMNNTMEPVTFDRTLLVGPNPVVAGRMLPVSTEPAAKGKSAHITLNPGCFYGRERRFESLEGEVTFHAYLLEKAGPAFLPTGPGCTPEGAIIAEPVSTRV